MRRVRMEAYDVYNYIAHLGIRTMRRDVYSKEEEEEEEGEHEDKYEI